VCVVSCQEIKFSYTSYIIRFGMKMLMVLLVLNVGTVLADCSKEEEQNNWNTIQWFIRNIL